MFCGNPLELIPMDHFSLEKSDKSMPFNDAPDYWDRLLVNIGQNLRSMIEGSPRVHGHCQWSGLGNAMASPVPLTGGHGKQAE